MCGESGRGVLTSCATRIPARLPADPDLQPLQSSMPAELKSPPITGVPAGREAPLETVYPSIAASAIGRFLGSLCDSIPLRIGGVQLSHVLFAPIALPFALIGYFQFKVAGEKYEVTNRSVRIRSFLGGRLVQQIALTDFEDVQVEVVPGQAFYRAGNVQLLNGKGDVVMTLAGVPRPDRLRNVILEARRARLQSDASLKVIEGRTA